MNRTSYVWCVTITTQRVDCGVNKGQPHLLPLSTATQLIKIKSNGAYFIRFDLFVISFFLSLRWRQLERRRHGRYNTLIPCAPCYWLLLQTHLNNLNVHFILSFNSQLLQRKREKNRQKWKKKFLCLEIYGIDVRAWSDNLFYYFYSLAKQCIWIWMFEMELCDCRFYSNGERCQCRLCAKVSTLANRILNSDERRMANLELL